MQSTSKNPVGSQAALDLLTGVSDLYVARGRNVVHVDMGESRTTSDDEILRLILGRSGTLRAPALRVGTSFFVGYNPDLLALIG